MGSLAISILKKSKNNVYPNDYICSIISEIFSSDIDITYLPNKQFINTNVIVYEVRYVKGNICRTTQMPTYFVVT